MADEEEEKLPAWRVRCVSHVKDLRAIADRAPEERRVSQAVWKEWARDMESALQALTNAERERDTYRETVKSAQEAGTRKHEELVRARNLLRTAQAYLEFHPDHQQCEGDPHLIALCEEIAVEIGKFEDNVGLEEEGRDVAKRLGIDIEKWAKEIRARIDAYTEVDRRTIVCLCGSTRFGETYRKANLEETLKGNIVLTVGSMTHSDVQLAITDEQKVALDKLHKDKITMADEILVLNEKVCAECLKDGDVRDHGGAYIGSSTKSEIEHALKLGKRVRFLHVQGPAWIGEIGPSSSMREDDEVAKTMKLLGLT